MLLLCFNDSSQHQKIVGNGGEVELQLDKGMTAVYTGGLPLGRGATAVVWPCILRNRDRPQSGDIVAAIKCAHGGSEEEKEKLETEISIWDGIPDHRNVVKLLAFRVDKGILREHGFMIYSAVERAWTDLDKLIFKDNAFAAKCTYESILVILIQVSKGLEHLHKHNIIHYDLKPRNVLIFEDGKARISDFGRSKLIDKGQNSVTVSFPGTLGHMAPEVWALYFPKRVTKAVDVFSLGVLMCIVLNRTYENPKDKKEPGQYIMCGSISGPQPLWCGAPTEFCELVESCLQYNVSSGEISDHDRPSVAYVTNSLEQMRGRSWAKDKVPSYHRY